ncbi:MAG TPA: prolipoprotein diacylglyceryl transferase family protein [Pyrinomonadaceae bacterium]|jgi:prolipoprotein diacylglyceryltransferase|nr:prolipoprotein diacylglyceryl transferase family protein [Pyrinomonadaceae bacterium]
MKLLATTKIRKFTRPSLQLRDRSHSAFLVWGISGIALTIPQSGILARSTSVSIEVVLLILFACLAASFCVVMLTKTLTGRETLTFYHHLISSAFVTFLIARALGEPVLPYLDLTVLGLGLILACGRIGCLMAGCCHGRPSAWGIQYSHLHVDEGFPPYLCGVTLLPVQFFESIYALCLVGAGITMVLRHATAGNGLECLFSRL